MNIADILITWR